MGGGRDVIRLTDKCHHTTSLTCVAMQVNSWAMSLDDAHDATWFVCSFDSRAVVLPPIIFEPLSAPAANPKLTTA